MCQKCNQHGRVPTKHQETLQITMTVLARDYRSFTSHVQGKQMSFNSSLFKHIVCICCSNEGKSAENVQSYLLCILAHKGGSVAILRGNVTEFKNKAFNEACDQHEIMRLFLNPFHPQG